MPAYFAGLYETRWPSQITGLTIEAPDDSAALAQWEKWVAEDGQRTADIYKAPLRAYLYANPNGTSRVARTDTVDLRLMRVREIEPQR
jgi:hypothetical protein